MRLWSGTVAACTLLKRSSLESGGSGAIAGDIRPILESNEEIALRLPQHTGAISRKSLSRGQVCLG